MVDEANKLCEWLLFFVLILGVVYWLGSVGARSDFTDSGMDKKPITLAR